MTAQWYRVHEPPNPHTSNTEVTVHMVLVVNGRVAARNHFARSYFHVGDAWRTAREFAEKHLGFKVDLAEVFET